LLSRGDAAISRNIGVCEGFALSLRFSRSQTSGANIAYQGSAIRRFWLEVSD
jgi:hypothetical protein